MADMRQATGSPDGERRDPEFELERLEKLYLIGDFRQVRREAKRLLAKDLSVEQQTATRNLLAATGIDPVTVVVFLLTAAALASIVVLYAN